MFKICFLRILIFIKETCIAGITEWKRPNGPPIIILSYESFRIHVALFQNAKADLLICDEAHRLKNAATETNKSLDSLDCVRRVLLSGILFLVVFICIVFDFK